MWAIAWATDYVELFRFIGARITEVDDIDITFAGFIWEAAIKLCKILLAQQKKQNKNTQKI